MPLPRALVLLPILRLGGGCHRGDSDAAPSFDGAHSVLLADYGQACELVNEVTGEPYVGDCPDCAFAFTLHFDPVWDTCPPPLPEGLYGWASVYDGPWILAYTPSFSWGVYSHVESDWSTYTVTDTFIACQANGDHGCESSGAWEALRWPGHDDGHLRWDGTTLDWLWDDRWTRDERVFDDPWTLCDDAYDQDEQAVEAVPADATAGAFACSVEPADGSRQAIYSFRVDHPGDLAAAAVGTDDASARVGVLVVAPDGCLVASGTPAGGCPDAAACASLSTAAADTGTWTVVVDLAECESAVDQGFAVWVDLDGVRAPLTLVEADHRPVYDEAVTRVRRVHLTATITP